MTHPYSIIIPARLDSTRLPRKVLLDIAGKPMLQHVVERAQQSHAERVIVATDSNEVRDVAEGFGATVCMTSDHPNGTSRVGDVVSQLSLADETVVVTVQGDEPLLDPMIPDQLVALLHRHTHAAVTSLCMPFSNAEDMQLPENVKVLMDIDGSAINFTRAVPVVGATQTLLQHIGLYCQTVGFLKKYLTMSHGEAEQRENLEQLRVLEHGYAIHMLPWHGAPLIGVNTQADLDAVREMMG
ncbi:MAG: 3-deoxy-manno-octulosonate cytidylyltransferase [marine bacterium B5-7]|nr:MAG: 3-deoxy-manno-octulosonate cytidylyltransferase [marine bacterium B5-7]